MKYWIMMMAGLLALVLWASVPPRAVAGSVEKIKDGSRKAVSEVKKEAVRAGKAAAETGREIKEGAVETGAAIKVGAKEVGRDIKKAYRDTRDAVAREISGDNRKKSGH